MSGGPAPEKVEEYPRQLLKKVINIGYDEPAIFLTLADIYEYDLNERKKTASYLQESIARLNDPEIESRLQTLQQTKKK